MSKIGEFIGRMFVARNVAHKAHLTTTVLARHVALEDFYKSIVLLADSFAEKYIAKTGRRVEDIDLLASDDGSDDPIAYFKTEREWIETNRYLIVDRTYSPLQNVIDEIVCEYLQVSYRLENLL